MENSQRHYLQIILIMLIFQKTLTAHGFLSNRVEPVSYYTNRSKEVALVKDNLQKFGVVSIAGVTSIGKTQLARHFVEDNLESFDLIWFFDLGSDLKEQFSVLAAAINIERKKQGRKPLPESPQLATKAVKNFLAPKKNWLLVFDNLRLEQNKKISDILSWQHNGQIIICSQDKKELPNIVNLAPFSENHANTMISKITNESQSKITEKILALHKGLPGGIAKGAFLLKENKYLKVEEYKEIINSGKNPIKQHLSVVLTLLSEEENKLLHEIALISNQKFSRNFLEISSSNKKNLGQSLFNLSRFGLIQSIEKNQKSKFEMHDSIREALLASDNDYINKQVLSEIIDRINLKMPNGMASHHFMINNDLSMKSNLEQILFNAEKFEVDIFRILELRKNLFTHYLAHLDYYNCQKMKEWLESVEKAKKFQQEHMTDRDKASYSWFYANLGVYQDFAFSKYKEATGYFKKAWSLIKAVDGFVELKFTIISQLAQTQAFGGEVSNSEANLRKVKLLMEKNLGADFDEGLFWFIKSKVSMLKGDYNQALKEIEKNIEAESYLPQDTFSAPTYIQQAEILNYQKKYNEAYQIIKKIHKQEIGDKRASHEIHGRILIQMARSELGISKTKDALKHIQEALSTFYDGENNFIDVDYASALIVKAEIMADKKRFEESLREFTKADQIFRNRYGKFYGKTDDVHYLNSVALKTALRSKDTLWIKKYRRQLIGMDNITQSDLVKKLLKKAKEIK